MQAIEWGLREKGCIPSNILEHDRLPECADSSFRLDHSLQKEFPCYPPCSSMEWRLSSSHLRTPRGMKITFEFSKKMEIMVEVRKLGITDVLSFVGGGTSLFLGCSCVTLMETFVFLLKLVLQSFNKETFESMTSAIPDMFKLWNPDPQISKDVITRIDAVNEEDVIGSTSMQASPHKSIHCVRFLHSTENDENDTRTRHYRPRPPSLSELKFR
ncbi:hypothetical protein COOONC_07371 [Cooperia oncophora]